ncbi:motility associated factor glycosyltransferase family protein [Shewanella sp. MF05960]|uniref:motility associated factor glycosyltransferase family protein n=1 Tax=Shewanella sp. MF05960 TaxID=3434874 RepID=UPI003D78EC86
MPPETEILNVFAISAFDEYYLPSINRSMFEKFDSKSLFDKQFKSSFQKEDTLYIIIGLDSGLLANYVLSMPLAKGSQYLFVEIDEVIELLNIDIPPEKHQVSVCNYTEFEKIIYDDRINIFLVKNQYVLHRSLAASGDYLFQYSCLAINVEKLVNDAVFEVSIGFTQRIFFRQQLKNICENHTPVSVLKGSFDNMTAIIVAGGPSLDETISWIKDNQSKLIIFAVSRVAGKLYEAGIIPHIIVSVDPEDFSFEVNRGMMRLAEKCLFVNAYHVSSRLLSQWQGYSLYMGSRLAWSQTADRDNIQTVGPTVTNTSVHLAINLGFQQVLLTGSDFCFSPAGFTHAKGSLETGLGPNLGFIGEWVQTYAGNFAETVVQLKMAAESLADDAENNPHVSIINLSENATKIDSIPHRHFQHIELTECDLTPLSLLDKIIKLNPQKKLHADYKAVLIQTEQANKVFNVLADKASKALASIESVNYEDAELEAIFEVSQKLESIELFINTNYADFAKLIKFYGYYEFSKFLTTKKSEDWDQKHLLEMSKDYYCAFNDIASDLILQTDKTISRIKSRLQELAQNIEVTKLAKQWRDDHQPGRVFGWLKIKERQGFIFESSNLQVIESLKSEYQEQFERKPTVYIDVVKSQSATRKVLEKILYLVHTKHVEGLKYMVRNLALLVDTDKDTNYLYHLAYSNQLLLQNNPRQALDVLQTYKGLHDELYLKLTLKLALILLELELASQTLEKIIGYSEQYMPQYAHILRLQGKLNSAVNVYLDYLERFPTDVVTWLKLGLFMIDVNEVDAAQTAFSKALSFDPSNHVAKEYLSKIRQK